MIVCYNNRQLYLLEPFDFRRFKVRLMGLDDNVVPEMDGLTFVDGHTALVSIELVPRLAGVAVDDGWRTGFDAMVSAARGHGWIDVSSHSIRAHVERVNQITS